MSAIRSVFLGVGAFTATIVPAWADDGANAVPEPSTLTLLALAVAGVLIGRRMAYRKPPKD